jgi:hypothetical protein
MAVISSHRGRILGGLKIVEIVHPTQASLPVNQAYMDRDVHLHVET